MGLSFRRTPIWLIKQRKRERRRQRDLLAVLLRGFAWCSRAHSEPPISTSRRSSRDTGPLSTLSHRGQSGLLLLSRMSRSYGCSSRWYGPICSLVTTVGNRDTSPVTAQCHLSKASSRASRTRSSKWLTSSQDMCTTPPSRVFLRELQ